MFFFFFSFFFFFFPQAAKSENKVEPVIFDTCGGKDSRRLVRNSRGERAAEGAVRCSCSLLPAEGKNTSLNVQLLFWWQSFAIFPSPYRKQRETK